MTKKIYTSLPSEITVELKKGSYLAGDNFNEEQLKIWFSQEKEAFYSNNNGKSEVDYWYSYMRFINEKIGFSKINYLKKPHCSMLVLGPGSGTEVDYLISRNPEWKIYFLEASENFKMELRNKYPKSYIIDAIDSGDINLTDKSQDLVCAFSVLHHIPNVSHVIKQIFRVIKPGGFFLVREPCSSMGDWRYPRLTTPNERGINHLLLTRIAQDSGFNLHIKPVPILFAPLNKFIKKSHFDYFISLNLVYKLDRIISWIVSINNYYWRDTWYKKIGPSAYFYIFRKPY